MRYFSRFHYRLKIVSNKQRRLCSNLCLEKTQSTACFRNWHLNENVAQCLMHWIALGFNRQTNNLIIQNSGSFCVYCWRKPKLEPISGNQNSGIITLLSKIVTYVTKKCENFGENAKTLLQGDSERTCTIIC